MSWRDIARMWHGHAMGLHAGAPGADQVVPRRVFRYGGLGSDGNPDPSYPTAGGMIAGGIEEYSKGGIPAVPGIAIKLEAGGAFSTGALLATDAQGRVVAATGSQIIVARAMETAAGTGSIVWCTFETQRPRGQW